MHSTLDTGVHQHLQPTWETAQGGESLADWIACWRSLALLLALSWNPWHQSQNGQWLPSLAQYNYRENIGRPQSLHSTDRFTFVPGSYSCLLITGKARGEADCTALPLTASSCHIILVSVSLLLAVEASKTCFHLWTLFCSLTDYIRLIWPIVLFWF